MRFILLIILSAFISCREEPKAAPGIAERACVYNDRIIGLQDALDSVRMELAVSVGARNAQATNKTLEKFKTEIAGLMDSLKTISDFEGDSSLRIAAAGLFGVYLADAGSIRSALPVLYKEDAVDTLLYPDSLAGPDSIDPNEALISVYERAVRRSKSEQAAFDLFFETQKAFAKKYGFVLTRDSGK